MTNEFTKKTNKAAACWSCGMLIMGSPKTCSGCDCDNPRTQPQPAEDGGAGITDTRMVVYLLRYFGRVRNVCETRTAAYNIKSAMYESAVLKGFNPNVIDSAIVIEREDVVLESETIRHFRSNPEHTPPMRAGEGFLDDHDGGGLS